jgi:hypothetical protein
MQRAMLLVSLVTANGVLIVANRASRFGSVVRTSNVTARWVVLAAMAAVLMAVYWPWSAQALQLTALPPTALLVAMGCGALGWPLIALWRIGRQR